MNVTADLTRLAELLAPVKLLLAQAQSTTTNEATREQLSQLSARMQKAEAGLMTSYAKEMAALQQRLSDLQKTSDARQEQVASLLQQAEAAEAAKKAAVDARKPTEEPLDPGLGRRLRIELLERFGDGTTRTGKTKIADPEILDSLRKQRF